MRRAAGHLALVLLLGAAATLAQPQPTSRSGLYLSPGRTAFDWSFSGYHDGDWVLPPPTASATYDVVLDFGAKGDGVADDTVALQAAVKAANAKPGVIQLPAGTYRLSKPLVITNSGVVLRGEGEVTTRIVINKSLADVYGGSWALDGAGSLKSLWSSGGAFIQFSGRPESSAQAQSLRAKVVGQVARGSTRLTVNTADSIAVGDWVRIFVNPAAKTSAGTGRRLLFEQAGLLDSPATEAAASGADGRRGLQQAASALGVGGGDDVSPVQLNLVDADITTQSEPVYSAAVQATHLLSGGEPGLQLDQALAADKAAGAPAGTLEVTAWLLGGDIVDGSAPIADELQFSAMVAATGAGWIELDRELPFAVSAGMDARVHAYQPSITESGVERLTISFDSDKPSRYVDHGTDVGFNAIHAMSAANIWINQVTIENAENGILLHWVDHATVLDVTIVSTRQRAAEADSVWQRQGHRGIALAMSHAVMVQRFNVASRYYHDLAVGRGALVNVFDGGRGLDLNLHHDNGSFGSLFADVDTGFGARPFRSLGSSGAGNGTTFWNLRADNGGNNPITDPPPGDGMFGSPPPPMPPPPTPPPPPPPRPRPPPPRPRPPPPSPRPPPPRPPSPPPPGSLTVLPTNNSSSQPPPAAALSPPPPSLAGLNASSPPPAGLNASSPPPAPLSSPPPPRDVFSTGCSQVLSNRDVIAGEIAAGPLPSWKACYRACIKRPDCGAMSWFQANKRCSLKPVTSGIYTTNKLQGARSVIVKACPAPPPPPSPPSPPPFDPWALINPNAKPNGTVKCGELEVDIELQGPDLGNPVVGKSLFACSTACNNRRGCSAFTFFEALGICRLKQLGDYKRRKVAGAKSVLVCPGPFPQLEVSPPAPPASVGNPPSAPSTPGLARRLLALGQGRRTHKGDPEADIAGGTHGSTAGLQAANAVASAAPHSHQADGDAEGGDVELQRRPRRAAAQRHRSGRVRASAWSAKHQSAEGGVASAIAPELDAAELLALRELARLLQRTPEDSEVRVPANWVVGSGGVMSGAQQLPAPVRLPACNYGRELNFFGDFTYESTCTNVSWLVQPLAQMGSPTLPPDLYSEQKYTRDTAAPLPEGAHRPTAADAATACTNDTATAGCWQLLYDCCIVGYTSRNAIPRGIIYNEPKVIAGLYLSAYRTGAFGSPGRLPKQFSRVCVPVPAKAGKAECSQVTADMYRVQTPGYRPEGWGQCDFQQGLVSFVQADIDWSAHRFISWTTADD